MGSAPRSSAPTSVNGGRLKSCSALPSRMNSGLTATRSAGPSRRRVAASSGGSSTFSVVPGRTVLRSTTVKGRVRERSACPICSATRWTALTSSWPLMRAGVPTQMSASSVLEIASSLEVVARSLPSRTWAASSSSSPGSMTGEVPALTAATFSATESTPSTSWPALARQAALTEPTYPRPKTLIRMTHRLCKLRLETAGDLRPGILFLDQPAARFAERPPLFGMPQERDDRPREGGRFVRQQHVPARSEGEALGPDGGGDHRLSHRQRLEDLEPRAAADAERHHVHLGLGDAGAHVFHRPGDAHPGCCRGRPQRLRRVSSDHRERDLGLLPADERKRGLEEAEDAVLVGVPVHRPAEDERGTALADLLRREVIDVDAGRHGADLGRGRSGGQGLAVGFRHRQGPSRPRARTGLVPAHLAPLEREQSAAPEAAFAVAEALPDLMLHVVLEEDHRSAVGRGQV